MKRKRKLKLTNHAVQREKESRTYSGEAVAVVVEAFVCVKKPRTLV
jgi:hypothetical protein